ncbi:serine/threonine-protein kinase [Gloeobacter kilaueensis]|uniref:Serine/threonine protein kinase n=1 Tax=Gloeobacter kilaueensis (strain ATCC BAA-2537 / CCAP 1431/1 / ULC 316 / JS1) TaxID=1183438 RepID=U5QJH9_GLOK1|nr:serine/threonine-protein kinase [Gloeobacter kilaueensis]AGY59147.1 serine/threonine protein kinase [Gloeobacter kilaueensis JS1]
MITSDEWLEIRRVLDQALELSPADRPAFVERLCADRDGLRDQVEALMAAYEEDEDFLETPAYQLEGVGSWLGGHQPGSLVGRRIGAYELKEEIGWGGMSTVYLAERADGHFEQRVALKLLKHTSGGDVLLKRFRAERQILASLKHPNIASLVDGGASEDGTLYLVMEYVEGVPIDVYCDTHNLTIKERLQLFAAVCSAVHYAHQNLIVHRDLKPANILVTGEGVPKLLDFGIAKLLAPDLYAQPFNPTVTLLRPMTPNYASPEQIKGGLITTASDIYSLGVLLYELLTGHLPFGTARLPHEVLRAVCEDDPPLPSATIGRVVQKRSGSETITLTPRLVSLTRGGQPEKLQRSLSGDLDNIVLKAMSRPPERRYASAQQLAQDIERHLDGLPVLARENTLWYRTRRFVRRNKIVVAAGCLIGLSLVGGIVATSREAAIAQAAQARAERRFNDVRQLANSLMFEIYAGIDKLPGATPTKKLLVTKALTYLDNLSQEAENDLSLQASLATAYQRVGDIQGNIYNQNLGDTAGALRSHKRAQAIWQKIVAARPGDTQVKANLAASYLAVGDLQKWTGDRSAAAKSYIKAQQLQEELLQINPADIEALKGKKQSYSRLGDTLFDNGNGDRKGAQINYSKSLMIAEALAKKNPQDRQSQRDLMICYSDTADAESDQSRAEVNYRKALKIAEKLSSTNSLDATARRDLWFSHIKLGDFLLKKDSSASQNHYLQALKIARFLAASDPKNEQARTDLAYTYQGLGDVELTTKNRKSAGAFYLLALPIRQTAVQADPNNQYNRKKLQELYKRLSDSGTKFTPLPTKS